MGCILCIQTFLYTALVAAAIYEVMCDIGPRYNGTWLYCKYASIIIKKNNVPFQIDLDVVNIWFAEKNNQM